MGITWYNPSAAPITDGTLTDTFDSRLDNIAVLNSSIGTASVSGNVVTVSGIALAPGQSGVVQISARVSNRARPGDVIPNTATFSYNPTFVSNNAPITVLPDSLPATGETPVWRWPLILLAVLAGGVWGIMYQRRRREPGQRTLRP